MSALVTSNAFLAATHISPSSDSFLAATHISITGYAT
jgi:hypothetical protein